MKNYLVSKRYQSFIILYIAYFFIPKKKLTPNQF